MKDSSLFDHFDSIGSFLVAHDIRDRSSKLRFQTDVPSSSPLTTHVSLVSSANDLEITSTTKPIMQSLPADIRLNMLTGLTNPCLMPHQPARSLASSTSTVHERSKDAMTRINNLIRQNSVQDVQKSLAVEEDFDDKEVFLTPVEHPTQQQQQQPQQRRRSVDVNPIQFYIDETKKLTENLENSVEIQTSTTENNQTENTALKITNLDDEMETPRDIQTVMETFHQSTHILSRSFLSLFIRTFHQKYRILRSSQISVQVEILRKNRIRRN